MYHILICDDQPDIVNALKIYLALLHRTYFFPVRRCHCAAEEKNRGRAYGVVITDRVPPKSLDADTMGAGVRLSCES